MQVNSAEWLKEHIPPGSVVYCIARHCSRSGMQREIGLLVWKDGRPVHLNYHAAEVLGLKLGKTFNAVIVRGAGMDMGLHLVDALAAKLYGAPSSLRHMWI